MVKNTKNNYLDSQIHKINNKGGDIMVTITIN